MAWQTILATDLRLLGYNVVLALDADEALDVAPEANVDVAIIDLMLPEPLDGRALLARLRERGLTFPVIFYTAYPVQPLGEGEEDSAPGVLGFVSKSVDRADLYALIPPAVLATRSR